MTRAATSRALHHVTDEFKADPLHFDLQPYKNGVHHEDEDEDDVMSSRSNVQRTRRVSFHGKTSVYEFERQLFGGGGVPDDDAVSLGLGPRLMNSYEGPLQEKAAKDEYGRTGSLAEEDREKLLAEFSSQKAVKRELDTHITPVVLRTQRERAETAVSAEEQRYMPTSEEEAHRVATEDAVVARKYLTTRPLTGLIRKRIGGTRV